MVSDNSELKRLYKNDQESRKKLDWNDKDQVLRLFKEDSARTILVNEMLREGKIKTARDLYHAAMIFQHGKTLSSYKLAVALSKSAAELGSRDGNWLYARALDRFLLKSGLKQKFGTQFSKISGKWVLDPYDEKTTDEERARYDVPSLEHQINVRSRQLQEER